uniref:IF rod domain-containing protein n=1 Tax=Anabas testudineus TaxID=64144 RepID=A0A7N6F7T8_ANATE
MEPLIKRQSSQVYGVSAGISRPLQIDRAYAHSVSGGAGGRGTRISTVTYGSRFGSSLGGGNDSQYSANLAIANEKLAMQQLNDRLATYLETVKTLEKKNSNLEIKIREAIEKRGPLQERDYSKYYTIIADLRAKIFDMIKGNAHFDSPPIMSLSMRQTVEADVARLRKILDDTNVIRLHLESDIESLKEELIYLKKNHKTEVDELLAHITQVGIHVDVDAPKGQDLARIMEEMRAKYEKIALKNQEEVKAWHESQISEVQFQVTENTAALKDATSTLSETKRRYQALDVELQSALSLNSSSQATLYDIEMRYNMKMKEYNTITLSLQEELTQIRADIQQNQREYEHLLNIKVKLEAEIAEYRRLLDGGAPLKLEDAVDQKKVETKVVTVTQTLVDGKVVSESRDVALA